MSSPSKCVVRCGSCESLADLFSHAQGPIPKFQYEANKFEVSCPGFVGVSTALADLTPSQTVALIAGGSGITPMWQSRSPGDKHFSITSSKLTLPRHIFTVLQAIDANPADKTKAVLIYSNVTEQDILLRQEFECKSRVLRRSLVLVC